MHTFLSEDEQYEITFFSGYAGQPIPREGKVSGIFGRSFEEVSKLPSLVTAKVVIGGEQFWVNQIQVKRVGATVSEE